MVLQQTGRLAALPDPEVDRALALLHPALSTVADAVGYESQAAVSRAFKRARRRAASEWKVTSAA